MSEATERPEIVTEAMLDYLDDLRESGVVNMFGAGEYVGRKFALTKTESRQVLTYWMNTFGERQEVIR